MLCMGHTISNQLPTLASFGASTKSGSWLFSEMRVNYRHFKRMLELNLHGLDTSKLLLKKNS